MPLALQALLAGVAMLAFLGFSHGLIRRRPDRGEVVWMVLLSCYFALGWAYGAGALS